MAIKQELKRNEARILIFLSQVKELDKNATSISLKLRMDFSNCLRLLKGMVEQGWLKQTKPFRKTIYELTNKTPIQQARHIITPRKCR